MARSTRHSTRRLGEKDRDWRQSYSRPLGLQFRCIDIFTIHVNSSHTEKTRTRRRSGGNFASRHLHGMDGVMLGQVGVQTLLTDSTSLRYRVWRRDESGMPS